jgi:hypothetical protein
MPFANTPDPEGPFDPEADERRYSIRLGRAIRNMHAFAATFNPDEVVDEESDLMSEDLNVLLEAAERVYRSGVDHPQD